MSLNFISPPQIVLKNPKRGLMERPQAIRLFSNLTEAFRLAFGDEQKMPIEQIPPIASPLFSIDFRDDSIDDSPDSVPRLPPPKESSSESAVESGTFLGSGFGRRCVIFRVHTRKFCFP